MAEKVAFELEGLEEEGEGRCELKPVKLEGVDPASYVVPLYAEQPTIVFDRVTPPTRKIFQETYGLSNEGLNPKRLKIGVQLEEVDVESLFGPCINRNGYRYCHKDDEELIREVESKYMICHQRTWLPSTCIINKSEARGIAYERVKKKPVN